MVKKRNDLFFELINRDLVGTAVEVGVAEGGFSFYLLDCWPGVCYQVDPWRSFNNGDYSDIHNISQAEQDLRYEMVLQRSEKYGSRSKPIRKTSEEASKDFEDNFFDFIHIDANHKLQHIQEDLKIWWPKCKSKGIFSGHDYLDGILPSGEYGVKTAVNEFALEHGLKIYVTQEPDYPTWWTVKP